MTTLRVLSSGRAKVWKLVLEAVRHFWTMRNVETSTQAILILSGPNVLAVSAPGGSWVVIRVFAIFLQSDPERMIGGIDGLVCCCCWFTDVVSVGLSVGLGIVGLSDVWSVFGLPDVLSVVGVSEVNLVEGLVVFRVAGVVDASVEVLEARDMEPE